MSGRVRQFFYLVVLLASLQAVFAAPAVDVAEHAAQIRAEAVMPNRGDEGRPLPLVAHWNTGADPEGFTPAWQMEMIEEGHFLLPWFAMPNPGATLDKRASRRGSGQAYYEAPIKRAAALKLPITFKATQWESLLYRDEEFINLPPDENPCVISAETGKVEKRVSPFGLVGPWRRAGRKWMDSPALRQLQEWYPDPPLVIFLSNNEAAKLVERYRGGAEGSKRYVDKHGLGRDYYYKVRVANEGYMERYRALLEGMRSGLPPAWRKNAIFIGYGNGPAPPHFSRWPEWIKYSEYVPGRITWKPLVWDGGSPSYYTHDWSAITDYRIWSPQVESMNWVPFLERETYKANPDYWFEFSVWDGDGGKPERSKRKFYESQGQTFTPDRYGGFVQFGMWLAQPRAVREFRGYLETRPTREPYFRAIIDAVDRVHTNPTLREFWRKGRLVENRAHRHPYQTKVPDEYKDIRRWYLLDTSLDPPRPWKQETELPVFALARVLGEKPDRRWLVYAHSPLGDRSDVEITIPDYGKVTIDVSVEGAFCQINEKEGTAKRLF